MQDVEGPYSKALYHGKPQKEREIQEDTSSEECYAKKGGGVASTGKALRVFPLGEEE
jgi:hypothetical protein